MIIKNLMNMYTRLKTLDLLKRKLHFKIFKGRIQRKLLLGLFKVCHNQYYLLMIIKENRFKTFIQENKQNDKGHLLKDPRR